VPAGSVNPASAKARASLYELMSSSIHQPHQPSRNLLYASGSSQPHAYASIMLDDAHAGPGPPPGKPDGVLEEDAKVVALRDAFIQSDARLAALFQKTTSASTTTTPQPDAIEVDQPSQSAKGAPVAKKPARTIDEDDYGDDEDEEEDEDEREESSPVVESPLLQKTLKSSSLVRSVASPASIGVGTPTKPLLAARPSVSSELLKTSEETRKRLQEDKDAAEDAAKQTFHSMFFTLEHDRAAMLEQQKIDELDRQVEAEVSGEQRGKTTNGVNGTAQQGSLSSANLGASSLMLKHLLARIDQKRTLVKAQDWQLRKLIGEVRKNRSKWASEDKIGQEELYESAERVLQELKAMTEHSGPFLNRVNKREAPDYYNIIKHPMDIGTMMKKLKNFQYKSKKDFVDDLNLIWSNCLKYNADPNHFLRKKALYMQKSTENLVFLIPDIVVRDRAEVEAEERKQQKLDADLDGMEDSDDEPIMAARGRKAPGQTAKKGNSSTSRMSAPADDDTPAAEGKPLASMPSSASLRNNFLRADSDAPMEGALNGFSTPPPGGNLTPLPLNGLSTTGAPPSQADASDVDGGAFSLNDVTQAEDLDFVDQDFHIWKQVTKKARATAAANRSRLFINSRLNPEETALLRNRVGMRRFLRLQQKLQQSEGQLKDTEIENRKGSAAEVPGQSLAEGVEAAEDDTTLPDYYDPVASVPDVIQRLRWEEDEEGQVVTHAEESLRLVPPGHFTAPESLFNKTFDAHMLQIQETRKVCAKIGVVKQMQMQMQVRIRISSPSLLLTHARCIKTNFKSTSLRL
jgi:transcriptional activator SPT7